MTRERAAYRSRWLFPGDGIPLERATLIVVEGRIADITLRHVPEAVDLGDVALIPPLVNAHAHLEFSHLTSPIAPARPFSRWIDGVIACRQTAGLPPGARIERGVNELREFGTHLVGEIATSPASADVLTESPLRSVVFREIIGLFPDHRAVLSDLRSEFAAGKSESATLRRAVSPHAPYSVHPELIEALVDVAIEFDRPIAMHLAETSGELELIAHARGEFREMLERFQLWPGDLWCDRRRILDYLNSLSRAPRGLVIHGNYLDDGDIAFLAEHPQLSVVYCPRTHAYFGHGPHPLPQLLARGVNVALGTDGRCSNPDLSVWNEVLFLRQHLPSIPPETLLRMATRSGAAALGAPSSLGTLCVGDSANFSIIQHLPPHESDPFRALLHAGTVATLGQAG